jgi:hypothetical protein
MMPVSLTLSEQAAEKNFLLCLIFVFLFGPAFSKACVRVTMVKRTAGCQPILFLA